MPRWRGVIMTITEASNVAIMAPQVWKRSTLMNLSDASISPSRALLLSQQAKILVSETGWTDDTGAHPTTPGKIVRLSDLQPAGPGPHPPPLPKQTWNCP